jgi:hypothetical protein
MNASIPPFNPIEGPRLCGWRVVQTLVGTMRGTLLCYAYARTAVWCGSVTTRYRRVHAEREVRFSIA